MSLYKILTTVTYPKKYSTRLEVKLQSVIEFKSLYNVVMPEETKNVLLTKT